LTTNYHNYKITLVTNQDKNQFEKIHHLLFDLDNTLYPASSRMDAGITSRMIEVTAKQVGLSVEEAAKLRSERMPIYGTSLGWLMAEHGLIDIKGFFETVHPESEIEELDFDPKLRPFLESISLPKTVLTNSPTIHANRVLDFFNIRDLFIFISDIETNGLRGKPYENSYLTAVFEKGYNLSNTLFFDDHEKYTKGYTVLGGKSILVSDKFLLPGDEGTFNCDYIVKDIVNSQIDDKTDLKAKTLENLTEIKKVILEKNPNLLPYASISSVFDVPKLLEALAEKKS